MVVDASAALSGLLNAGQARAALADGQIHVPHLIDPEIAHGVRRHVAQGALNADAGWAVLDTWRHLSATRYPVHALLDRVWQLRDNASAYDACYVALAEALGCGLLTADARLARIPGAQCSFTVVPR